MKALKVRNFILIIFLFIVSCNKKEEVIPILFTGQVTNITKDGAVFSGSFKNIDTDKLIEFGFLWGNNPKPDLNNSLKYSFTEVPSGGIVEYKNNSSLKSEIDYYLRTFLRYENRTYYGNIVSFFSLGSKAPVILDVIPSLASFGDTIKLLVENVKDDTKFLKVNFNNDSSKILKTSDSSIIVIVPYFSQTNSYFIDGKVDISLNRYNNVYTLKDKFTIAPPDITSCPSEGLSNNQFTIKGKGFHLFMTKVYIGDYQCNVIKAGADWISVVFPPSFIDFEGVLKVNVGVRDCFGEKIKVYAPIVNDNYPAEVFSYEKLFLIGHHLNNSQLKIRINDQVAETSIISDDTIQIEVPGLICAKSLVLEFELGNIKKIYNKLIKFKQPGNIEIQKNNNNYFDGDFTILGDYFPKTSIEVQVNDGLVSSNYYFSQTGKSSIKINVPAYVQPKNGWMNANIKFCNSTILEIPDVFYIPAPVITDAPATLYSNTRFKIQGKNFNSIVATNYIVIDNEMDTIAWADNTESLSCYPISPTSITTGQHKLKVVTNGQSSNEVDINIINVWNRITLTPIQLQDYPIVFISNGIIYVGGGLDNIHANDFYAYNINSNTWTKKASLPIHNGISVSGDNYGYLIGEDIYRYDFLNDKWSFQISATGKNAYTSVIYNNKIFLFGGQITDSQYFLDLNTNQWNSYPGYSGNNSVGYGMGPCILSNDTAYIIIANEKYFVDLNNLKVNFILKDNLFLFNDRGTKQGFEYNGELYLYITGWGIFNPKSFDIRGIDPAPIGTYYHIFRIGDLAYVINSNEIWTFNLEMQ